MAGVVESLAPAKIERERSLFGLAPDLLIVDVLVLGAVDGLQVVKLGVEFGSTVELAPGDQAAAPLVGTFLFPIHRPTSPLSESHPNFAVASMGR